MKLIMQIAVGVALGILLAGLLAFLGSIVIGAGGIALATAREEAKAAAAEPKESQLECVPDEEIVTRAGFDRVHGTLLNLGPSDVEQVRLTVTLLDRQGKSLEQASVGVSDISALGAKEWKMLFPITEGVDDVRCEVKLKESRW